MKKQIMIMLVALVLVTGFSFAGLQDANQDFTLVNETGVTIDSLYISKVSSNHWEEDVLGVDTLPDGEEVEISFDSEENACKWDIMIKDEDGNEYFWRNINLCKIEKLTLHYEDGKAWATEE